MWNCLKIVKNFMLPPQISPKKFLEVTKGSKSKIFCVILKTDVPKMKMPIPGSIFENVNGRKLTE